MQEDDFDTGRTSPSSNAAEKTRALSILQLKTTK